MMVNRIQNIDRSSESEHPNHNFFQSDEFIWDRYLATDDRNLFDRLVHRYEDEIYRHLFRLLGNAQWAEDARQGTFLKMHLKRNQFHPGRALRPWLYAIATHEAIDLQRKNKRHRMQSLDQPKTRNEHSPQILVHQIEGTVSPPGQSLEKEEIRMNVRRSVNNLPISLRQPLELVYYKGLKIREAADRLGIPQGTVKSRMRKAIDMLNKMLADLSGVIVEQQHQRILNPRGGMAVSKIKAKARFKIYGDSMMQK
tara:strand:- start:2636 stop:3397 length:762 start_codon:yes stop_codon:yes gene_type:complete